MRMHLQEERDTSLSRLRLTPQDDADLVWFWGEASGEMGLKAQSYERGYGTDREAAERSWLRRMQSAQRFGRVRKGLDRMPKTLVRVLQRWCGPHRPDPRLVVAFGPFAGIVTLTQAAATLERSYTKRMVRAVVAETWQDEPIVLDAVRRVRAGAPHAALFDVMTMLKVLECFDVEAVAMRAVIPWVVVAAQVDFDNKDKAKARRYSWEALGDKRFPRQWVKRVKECDVDKEKAEAPFEVVKIA